MKSKLRTRVGASLFIAVILYNEWFSLWVDRWNWKLGFLSNSDAGFQRILLVADAQIQGYNDEPPFPIGSITRWDSDRFLHNGYMAAVRHFHPDVIIFLGDELDEGSKATSEYFTQYRLRFASLFPIPDNALAIFIPGDNDIGGEGLDLVTSNKKRRFQEEFEKETYVSTKFSEFIKVDLMSKSDTFNDVPGKSDKIRVILTHIPLTLYMSKFSDEVLTKLGPHLILSGHEHTSHIVEGDKVSRKLINVDSFTRRGQVKDIDVKGQKLHEIIVPSCSYRMGVPKIGYGAAILSSDGTVNYTVLWLTNRYFQLYLYVIILVIEFFIFFFVFVNMMKNCCISATHYFEHCCAAMLSYIRRDTYVTYDKLNV